MAGQGPKRSRVHQYRGRIAITSQSFGFGGLLNLCRDPEEENEQRSEVHKQITPRKSQPKQEKEPRKTASPKSVKKSSEKSLPKEQSPSSKKSILKKELRPVNDYEPSSNLMALLSRKSMIERVTSEMSQAMEEEEVNESPKKCKKGAKSGKASKKSKKQASEQKGAVHDELEDDEDDDDIEIDDINGPSGQMDDELDDDDDIEEDDGNDADDESSSDEESQDEDEESGTGSRKKKGRTREKKVLKLQKVGKKKGKKFKSREQKINDAVIKPTPANGKPVIVQHPIGFPVEQMKELTTLLKASIDICKDRQTTQNITTTRDEVAVQITRAVLAVCSKGMKNKLLDWAKSNCEPELVTSIKERLGLFSKVKKLGRDELRKLQHKQEDERKVGLLEENYNSEKSDEESGPNSEANETVPEQRSQASGSIDQSRGLHYNKIPKQVGLPLSNTIYDNQIEKQSQERLRNIDKMLQDKEDIDPSIYTIPREGSQFVESKNETRKQSIGVDEELKTASIQDEMVKEKTKIVEESVKLTHFTMNLEISPTCKDTQNHVIKKSPAKLQLINEINPELTPMVTKLPPRGSGGQEYPLPVEVPVIIPRLVSKSEHVTKLHKPISIEQIITPKIDNYNPLVSKPVVVHDPVKISDEKRRRFEEKYPPVKPKKDLVPEVPKEKDLFGEIVADNLKEERRIQREKRAKEEKERVKLMKKTSVPQVSNGSHQTEAHFSDDSEVDSPKRGGLSEDDDDSFYGRGDSKRANRRSRSRSRSKSPKRSPKRSPLKQSAEKLDQKIDETLQLETLVDEEDNKFRNISLMMNKSMEDQEDSQMHLPLHTITYSGEMDHHQYSQDNNLF